MADDNEKIALSPLEIAHKKIKSLEDKLDSIGVKGDAKLYYSLNKNMSDLADLLDTVQMNEIDLSDPKDKSMERLKTIWAAITPLSETLKFIRSTAGITGDREQDTKRKPFNDMIAEDRK